MYSRRHYRQQCRVLPRMAAMIEVASSGIEVPAATIVSPITSSDTPELSGNRNRRLNKPVRSQNESSSPAATSSRFTTTFAGALTSFRAQTLLRHSFDPGLLLATRHNRHDRVCDQTSDQQQSVQLSYASIKGHHEDQD